MAKEPTGSKIGIELNFKEYKVGLTVELDELIRKVETLPVKTEFPKIFFKINNIVTRGDGPIIKSHSELRNKWEILVNTFISKIEKWSNPPGGQVKITEEYIDLLEFLDEAKKLKKEVDEDMVSVN